jgi:hypothetical protein
MNAIGIIAAVLMWGFGLAGIVCWFFLARWALALGWAPGLRGSEPRTGVRALVVRRLLPLMNSSNALSVYATVL